MDRIIEKVEFPIPSQPKALKVAAYARVSSGKDAMLHSLSSQVSYYSNLIQSEPGWLYCGVYTDEAVTGTKETRADFQQLLTDCRAGTLDLVITKSISRFARNTVTLLETVRELKSYGIDVFFEEQNIHTMSADGELMMSILASYAQEESRSVSENQKWRIKKNFEEGKPWNVNMLGYRYENGNFVIVPEEAVVVKRIFDEYLSGLGAASIQKGLNRDGLRTLRGKEWLPNGIMKVLRNYAYTGNLLLQTTYRKDHISKQVLKNHGEKPKYHVADSHEPIISLETFDAVQTEIAKRASQFARCTEQKTYPFTGMMTCGICGKHYQRKVTYTGPVWICSTFNSAGKSVCASKQIPESTLTYLVESVKADNIGRQIKSLQMLPKNQVSIIFSDGTSITTEWKDRSRSDSWTDEMREAARQKRLQRRKS